MSQAEDILLISQVRLLGSRRAFDRIVRKYQSPLRRLLMGLTGGDADMADDVAQDTFIKAWTYINDYRASSSFKTWLFAIAYRVFYDYAAYNKRYAHDDISSCQNMAGNEGGGDTSVQNMDLYNALDKIREEERTAILLFYMEGWKYEEIAAVMGIPIGTVKTLLYRGKEHLASLLKR